jgi:hypothetical protein
MFASEAPRFTPEELNFLSSESGWPLDILTDPTKQPRIVNTVEELKRATFFEDFVTFFFIIFDFIFFEQNERNKNRRFLSNKFRQIVLCRILSLRSVRFLLHNIYCSFFLRLTSVSSSQTGFNYWAYRMLFQKTLQI